MSSLECKLFQCTTADTDLASLVCTPTLYYPYTPTNQQQANEMDQAEDRIKDESHDTCMLILRVLSLGCLGNSS
ncbi:hypothetical protein CEP53_013814 [Fusarium sp. AF-6]|nr:hypothetical protein CEP53_013814 [Fusarium sp. AF-6]